MLSKLHWKKVFYRVKGTLQHGTKICVKCNKETMACRHNNIFINWTCFSFTCYFEETFQNILWLFLVCSFPSQALFSFIAHTNQPIQLFLYTKHLIQVCLFWSLVRGQERFSFHTKHFPACFLKVSLKVSERYIAGCFSLNYILSYSNAYSTGS